MFVAQGLRRSLLRKIILATSRRARVITTNGFIESRFKEEQIDSFGQAAIWPPDFWLTSRSDSARDIDVVAFLRRGHMKRLDLYLDMLARFDSCNISYTAITPDPDIYQLADKFRGKCLFRPTNEGIRVAYQEARIFLLLSDTEGFGLPPLEAMGSGCVPLCRDSGGPRCYMQGALAANLVPLDETNDRILERIRRLLANPSELTALSHISQSRFRGGLAEAQSKREECLKHLVEALTAAPSDPAV